MSDGDTDPAGCEERRRVTDALEDSSSEVDDVAYSLPSPSRRARKRPGWGRRRATPPPRESK